MNRLPVALPVAANDDAPCHDLFSTLKLLSSLDRLPVRQLAWLVAILEGRDFGRLTLGELLDLVSRSHTLPRLLEGVTQ